MNKLNGFFVDAQHIKKCYKTTKGTILSKLSIIVLRLIEIRFHCSVNQLIIINIL